VGRRCRWISASSRCMRCRRVFPSSRCLDLDRPMSAITPSSGSGRLTVSPGPE
jgi:hypothetical protein